MCFQILYALLIAIGAAAALAEQLRGQDPSPVEVAPVIEREVASGQTFVGTVMPSRSVVIGSAVAGRVVDFPLNEGDQVASGQAVARLLTDTVALQVKAAEGRLALYKEELAELENGSRPEEIAQARAKMAGAEAQQKYTLARRQRAESLFARGRTVTEEERDEAVAAAVAAEQAYLEAKAAYELAVAGPRQERIAQARAQVAIQDALLQELNDQLQKHTIISRFDGYITAEHTEVGAWLKQGDPVVAVAALDEVEIAVGVVEEHAAHLRPGMSVRVEVPALANRVFTGVVSHVVPQADVRARTFPVKLKVQNEMDESGPVLKAGMFARAMLPTGPRMTALMVPKDALVLGGAAPSVFVVRAGSEGAGKATVEPVPVTLGVADGTFIQVQGPLAVGQRVVVRGNERLFPNQQVVISREWSAEPMNPVAEGTAAGR